MALDADEPVIAEDEIIVLDLDGNDTPQEAVEMTMDLPELTGDEERKATHICQWLIVRPSSFVDFHLHQWQ